MKKFDQYLLTHYPLLWNTRIVWVLLFNFIMHLFFLLVGFGSIRVEEFQLRSTSNISGEVFTFSALCSLLVLIVWLVFFLRNNAFKNFYRIDKWHLAKEFVLILVIIFSSITYFQSLDLGARLRVRSITSPAEYRKESDMVNQAMAFIPPSDKSDYFILNDCARQSGPNSYYGYNGNTYNVSGPEDIDNNFSSYDTATVRLLRRSLSLGNAAFLYTNYCAQFIEHQKDWGPATRQHETRNRWLAMGKKDSIRYVLNSLLAICNKYSIDQRLNIDELINMAFATPDHQVLQSVADEHYYTMNTEVRENRYYLERGRLHSAFYYIDESIIHSGERESMTNYYLTEAYVAFGLSVLLLGYRRFSRKVFLISIIGTIVWAILIGLIMSGAHGENGLTILCMLLCLAFLVGALMALKGGGAKTAVGVLLTWHSYLAPYFLLFLQIVISSFYDDQRERVVPDTTAALEKLHRDYPFSYWVHSHQLTISFINFFLILIYFSLVYNKMAKSWQASSEQ